jgi:DnaJ-class molecular chaperone
MPKAERLEALTVEIQLTADQAARGVIVPLAVPVFSTCPACRGRRSNWLAPCPTCAQQGIVEGEVPIRVDLPPGTRTGTVRELPLVGLGIDNLFLRLVVQVV